VLGLVTAIRKEAWPVVLFAAVSLLGFLVVAGRASPWAYAKALMLLSPAVVLLAGVTVAGWWDSSRRVEAAVVGALLITGIVWTNAQTYHGVSAAPHDRMAELDRINDKFAGRGPAFYFESEEFAKYFLRDLAPTGATEAYSPGQATAILPIRFGYDSDADDWSPKSLAEHFKLLVVRRGPTASRPSSAYRRVWSGRWYDVWELDPAAPPVLAAMPLGTRLDAAEDIPCSTRFERLAQTAADAGGRLTYVPRDKTVAFRVTRSRTPDEWFIDPGDDETWRPEGQGRLEQSVRVDTAGTYTAWLEASVGREATLYVDDQRVGSLKNHLNPRGSATQVGTVTLEPGLHRFRLDLAGGSPDPRNGGRNRLIGPAYLTTQANPSDGALRTVEPGQWRSLCGEHADWVQATGPA
jgi:hypothetical protein